MSRVRVTSVLVFACMAVSAGIAPQAMGAIVGTNDPNTLAGAMSNSNETGATLDVAPASSTFPDASADSPLSGFPTAGNTFTILTTGDSALADDPNDSESSGASVGYNSPSRGDANDPTTLRR